MTAVLVAVVVALAVPGSADAFIYWSDSQGSISRANLDGSGSTLGFVPGASNPCGVAVDGNYIYWANGTGTTIGRANLDGTHIDQSFITGATHPCGVAVNGQHVYWANGGGAGPGGGTIGRANLDGTNVNQSFITGATSPDSIAVDGTYIYWANRGPEFTGEATIGRARIDGTGVNDSFISGASQPCGIAVDGAHVYWTNQPVVQNPDHSITFEPNTVGRANLDGTNPNQDFITGPSTAVGMPPSFCGLAVDSASIYWTVFDPAQNSSSLGRAALDGSAVNENFVAGAGVVVNALAVDTLVGSTMALVPSPASTVYGEPMSFNASVARQSPPGGAPAPTGSVAFTVTGESPLSVPLIGGEASFDPDYYLNVGDTVAADYSGDGTYGASATAVTPPIAPARTITSLTAAPNPADPTADVTFTATVTNESTGIIPFGSVQFVIGGFPIDVPQPLDENGQVTGFTVTGFDPGDYAVQALYHDDTGPIPDFTDSQASLTELINTPAATTVSPVASPTPLAPPLPNTNFTLLMSSVDRNGDITLVENAPDPGTFTASAATRSGYIASVAKPSTKCKRSRQKRKCVGHPGPAVYGTGSATSSIPGRVSLTIKPNARARAALARGTTLHVTVSVTFLSARGGAPHTEATAVTVKGAKPVHSRRPQNHS